MNLKDIDPNNVNACFLFRDNEKNPKVYALCIDSDVVSIDYSEKAREYINNILSDKVEKFSDSIYIKPNQVLGFILSHKDNVARIVLEAGQLVAVEIPEKEFKGIKEKLLQKKNLVEVIENNFINKDKYAKYNLERNGISISFKNGKSIIITPKDTFSFVELLKIIENKLNKDSFNIKIDKLNDFKSGKIQKKSFLKR